MFYQCFHKDGVLSKKQCPTQSTLFSLCQHYDNYNDGSPNSEFSNWLKWHRIISLSSMTPYFLTIKCMRC